MTGFSIKSLSFPNAVLVVKEIGGSLKQRKYWDRYFDGVSALIYVVDASSPKDNILDSISGLSAVLASPHLADVPVLVIANKQDLPGAVSAEEVQMELSFYVHLCTFKSYMVDIDLFCSELILIPHPFTSQLQQRIGEHISRDLLVLPCVGTQPIQARAAVEAFVAKYFVLEDQ